MSLASQTTGMTVLGTEIFDVDGDNRPTVLLSDLHVPEGGGQVARWLATVLANAGARRARVLVLGDLFDTYITPAQLRAGIWKETAAMFAGAVRAGAGIAVLHGNRDFLLGDEWTRATGAVVVRGGMRIRLAGVRALLLHGDELCQDDVPYQRAKKWLRRPLLRAIARRLPLWLALRVAARARQRSRQVIQQGDQARFLPTAAAIQLALQAEVEWVVFGHIHRRARGLCAGGAYWVLPAFDEEGVHLQAGQELSYVDVHGAPLMAPAGPLPGL